MPLYPALALLSGRAVFAAHRGVLNGLRDLGTRIGFAIWWLVGLAATLGLSILVIIAGRVDQSSSILAALKPYALPGVVIAIALLASGRSLVRGFYFRAQMLSLVAVVLWGATLLQFILPGAQRFWVSSRIAATIDISKLHTPYWSMGNASGFNEDSLVFLVRGEPMGGSVPSIDDPKFNCDWMALATGSVDAQAWLASPRVRVADRVRGWNYSNGKPVDIIIFDRGRLKP
jgi:hypothetical protein